MVILLARLWPSPLAQRAAERAAFDAAAVGHEGLHALQHASLVGSALLVWWSVLGRRQPRRQGIALSGLFTTMLHTAALGALLTLASTVLYASYQHSPTAFGLEPLVDQQLGGLIMWIPGGLGYLWAMLAIANSLLVRQPQSVQQSAHQAD